MLTDARTATIEIAMMGSHTKRLEATRSRTFSGTAEVFLPPDTMESDSNAFCWTDITLESTFMYAITMALSGMTLMSVRRKKLYCQPSSLPVEKVKSKHEAGMFV